MREGFLAVAARLRHRAKRLREEERRVIVAIDLEDGAQAIEDACREIDHLEEAVDSAWTRGVQVGQESVGH